MNAQMNANGQSRPPVAMPIQLAALMADAWGWPHFRASCPGSCPNLTTTITATAIRMANTKKANASKGPKEVSMVHNLPSVRMRAFLLATSAGRQTRLALPRGVLSGVECRVSKMEAGVRLLKRKDALPVVLHADHRPVLLLRHVIHRLAQGADLGVGESLRRAVGVFAYCIVVHHHHR